MKKILVLMSVSVLFSGIMFSCKKNDNLKEKPVIEDRNKSFTIGNVSFKMIEVKGGSFNMGAQKDDPKEANYNEYAESLDGPVHKVTISDYYIGEFEVTQALWMAVMTKDNKDYKNPSSFGKYPENADDAKLPVDGVRWGEIYEKDGFLDKLNNILKDQLPQGKTFRLPTEAEWEFAARGGSKYDPSKNWAYSGSPDVDKVGWIADNSAVESVVTVHAVGGKDANELGLYDMAGNVWEWCSDWFDKEYYKKSPDKDPKGPETGTDNKVMRGGAANSAKYDATVFRRNYGFLGHGARFQGLRLAL